jgi:hypothetical protein
MIFSSNQPAPSRRRAGAGLAARGVVFGLAFFAGAAMAQEPSECARLRAALAAPVRQDPEAAAAAGRVRAELDRAASAARSMGCDNQQFLIFGQAPPSQCGGVKAHVAALRAQFESLSARASGGAGGKQAIQARYDAVCVQRPKNFWETLFGGGREEPPPASDLGAPPPPPTRLDETEDDTRNGAHGGSQAVCVRTCDGGFFPLSFSAKSASDEELADLCKALCPNAEVKLYTRNPNRDISTALGIDGTAYSDLPNALKYAKAVEPGCGCKPPNQSWVEALAHAEELLGQMGGAKASDTTVTEEQARALSQPAAKPAKIVGRPKPAPAKGDANLLDTQAKDGNPGHMRVVGPKL